MGNGAGASLPQGENIGTIVTKARTLLHFVYIHVHKKQQFSLNVWMGIPFHLALPCLKLASEYIYLYLET